MKLLISKMILFLFVANTMSVFATTNLHEIKSIHLGSVDVYKAHYQDVMSEKLGSAPRFAVAHEVNIDPMSSTNLQETKDGWIWRYRVIADNAVSLNFAFFDFNMSKNSKLSIYSSDYKHAIRPFTHKDNNSSKQLWTPIILSNDVVIELYIPTDEIDFVSLKFARINQGYRTFSQSTDKSGSCNVDVVCTEGDEWRDEINSVAVISTGGTTFCTGFMVNNTSQDKTPYFMTANHCRINKWNESSLVTYWNYQASVCGGTKDGNLEQFNTGSTWLASSRKSDFTLVRLTNPPEDEWNVNFAGWDRSGEDAISAVAIHHPSTDEKSISFENEPTTITAYLKEEVPGDSTHIRVEDWDVGTTEPGSSGSPLFNQDHRVIGQLHGGYASCRSQTSDWYGSIHSSWEGDGQPASGLKSWLDSAETGELFVDTI
ncbi:MAG: trypsin-like peptidase domain-containing protein [Bacteriovoracaceae bacterium]|nr:trypsin-like peptidase domain-containing protein [Bacteriovoracaceae bacterium]